MLANPKEIHLVSFNVPYPANYGGVIDVFYKIKALYELGVKVNLHCFKYGGRESSDKLEKYCKSVTYYPRFSKAVFFFSHLPFIVKSRSNKELLNNLRKDDFPVICEGLHTTHLLKSISGNGKRNIIVRTHNIEHKYYYKLAGAEKNIFKKGFLYSEAIKLKIYQKILKSNIKIAAITESDKNYFSRLNSETFYIPAFHSFINTDIKTDTGDYILYHGDLSVSENIKAASYIIKNICSVINIPFVIAGHNPNKLIYKLAGTNNNVKIIANPINKEMQELIRNAQINLLITFQDTGIKLKLINSLFNGRFCIANSKMTKNSGLESLCVVKNSPTDIINEINNLISKPFTISEINKREKILLKIVNNAQSAQKLINLLFKN
ncbi:MAG: glycosyltransferase family 1 protein [Bacteroidales bacterium]|nr:glycosyltransferase family 1 protein [Bacteroidales bacterium]